MKIAFTGNPNYGLAQEWARRINGTIDVKRNIRYDTDFFSRRNNWNFDDIERRRGFALDTLNYDIVINNSALWNFHQTLLLKQIWDVWNENKKQGRIINIGSTADRSNGGTDWLYPTEKKALRFGVSPRSNLETRPSMKAVLVPRARLPHPTTQTNRCHRLEAP